MHANAQNGPSDRKKFRTLPYPLLMLVTEPMECARLASVAREAEAGGVNAVQLRDSSLSAPELTRVALALRECLPAILLLVNGCPAAADESGAGGVHLPERGGSIRDARLGAGAAHLVGRSVHSVQAAVHAAAEGADYLIAGTIFASRSHPGTPPTGIEFLRRVCRSVEVPVIAIGGITPENAGDCISAGAAGIAVLSSILHAPDPREAAARYRAVLDRYMGDPHGIAGKR